MTGWRRWVVVAGLVLLVVATPAALRALPAQDEEIGATALLARIEASRQRAWSGYAESRGRLQLPVADRFTDVGALFGERTRMRAWWRGPDDWRVDKLLATGETDLVHAGGVTTRWDYEDTDVDRSVDPAIRLPRTADLLPPALARRLLEDVSAAGLERLPARRVAGRDALGLRLVPGAPQSSIDHVDVWADRDTGVPLRVEVHATPEGDAVLTSQFREFSAATPVPERTEFRPPAGAHVSFDAVLDIADAANQFAPFLPPPRLAGLPRSGIDEPGAGGAVGVYGVGVTQVVAIPLRDREADPLRTQLQLTPGSRLVPEGTLVELAPLGVLLTGGSGEGGWLLAGTVTTDTLVQGARDLARHLAGGVWSAEERP